MKRLRIRLNGTVQGVGFRPFVYRIAKELGLKGYVLNDSFGVEIEAEGKKELLDTFLKRLNEEKPPLARIYSQEIEFLEPLGYTDFEIRESKEEGKKEVLILPDIATCEDCLRELFDPKDRRYLYPFINCTNCGPRFTIIEKLPYDRPNTTMKVFDMCPNCRREYEDPLNRRFHAQPNACPVCGPWVSLYDREGNLIAEREEAIELLLEAIMEGKIVAVKGVGGFHLICDARKEESVRTLRERKRRQEKPFAVMFRDLKQVEEHAEPTELEKGLLISPERPIVLVKKRRELAPSVAPGLSRVGAFLPYSPLHHIILRRLGFPVVATSGNLSDEPIVKDNDEALEKLSQFADIILLHNREIRRRCDDSVVKVIGGIPTPIRRSRGYAPLPVRLPFKLPKKVLAVGGMLKNTFALGMGDRAILSQHIGDVENLTTLEAFEEAVFDLMELYEFEPEVIVCDLHPRYETTRWAEEFSQEKGIPLLKVQHHYAHVLSCMAENSIEGKVLGIAWDGTGYGEDGTLWGGEFLLCDYRSYERAFYFKPFRLIGGEKVVKEPRRVALSILFELFGEEGINIVLERLGEFSEREIINLYRSWERGINSPYSSSVGRLFDGVASLLGIRQVLSYEGQAAMMIEDLYDSGIKDSFPYEIEGSQINWAPIFLSLLEEENPKVAASKFINTLVRIALDVARRVGEERVCLSGGVMQNDPLVSKIRELLEENGFKVYTHQRVPPNDGGISLGQVVCSSEK
ncbi:hydrogenase maturation carbamoyltransferase HypF [Hydrogenivirga caldilitoris]|uniref:Carbamoyltransferase n=1 Tax=Hydrogenivirga caldilitoris TaxID=246264 RepID=A0A497XPA2_9AQUI|nr:carbamoyltransferase HypF [Hydrogenivirga caldilitoris]RLJ70787.1 hydrogenase maturation carbamoyltransferase HypF [Hydrogenivirga caldilitoris]